MESLKKLATKSRGAIVSGLDFFKKDKRPSQEELEKNGIRVDIFFNVHCQECENEFRKCCESMRGVSEVDIDQNERENEGYCRKATVTGVFDSKKLVRRIWRKLSKKAKISKQEKIGGGNGSGEDDQLDGEGNEQEEEEEIQEHDRSESSKQSKMEHWEMKKKCPTSAHQS